ncbi:MAG: histidine--tRNA ligase [Clostridia bacterium]|uniref:histidine--tRNA ligase n=1 Tax=Pumilibacter muris TaxID=2941510 RepID=UPI00203E48AA|nr:histidine--tRNA ligase [Pumilibacter muris]MCI8595937.1 histidine--tRNA ligase [Clostridia bacterium]
MISIPRGTKDVLPSESHKWQQAEALAREICALYNAREIRTPAFEHTELFLRSIGDDTDVVGKEMYTFTDKGGRSVTLKPEGTAPVARSYVENSLESETLPLKMFYFSPVFRYERPAAGRLREHHQFGVEFYGGDAPEYDFEVISLAYDFLIKFGITSLSLNINSIGCPNCRKAYNEALRSFGEAHKAELCETCHTRLKTNPLRIIDCKVPSCKSVVANAPSILDYICDDCAAHMERLKTLLTAAKIPFKVDSGIVRGLDYYTKTVFEFVTDALGAQGTVCGGGRYDNLVESVGGKHTPCVGFGMGIERLILLKEALNSPFKPEKRIKVMAVSQSPEFADDCTMLVRALRSGGISADCDSTGRSLKAQFKFADKQGAEYAAVIGESEKANGTVTVKRLSDGHSESCAVNAIVEFFASR